MSKGKNRYEGKLYVVDASAAQGRKKLGETAVVEATDALDATDQILALAREGIPADQHGAVHSVTVRMEKVKAPTANPFGSS